MKRTIIFFLAILLTFGTINAQAKESVTADNINNNHFSKEKDVLDAMQLSEESLECLNDHNCSENLFSNILDGFEQNDALYRLISQNVSDFLYAISTIKISEQTSPSSSDSINSLMIELINLGANRFEIVNWAYNQNIISEEEKYISYCDIIDRQLFDNIYCLTGIRRQLDFYRVQPETTDDVKNRITNLFIFKENHLDEGTFDISYTRNIPASISDNFYVFYDSNITYAQATQVADCLENLLAEYRELGFQDPIPGAYFTKYPVYLYSGSNTTVAQTWEYTVEENNYGVAAGTCIELYFFNQLSSILYTDLLAHELFHAIMGSYIWPESNAWFDEALANYGKIIVTGRSATCDEDINEFINTTLPMNSVSNEGYGSCLFPLTMHSLYGSDAIIDILEKYGQQTSRDVTFTQLKEDVVDEALSAYDSSFDEIFLKMAANNTVPSYQYKNVHPGGQSATSEWINNSIVNTNALYSTISEHTVVSRASVNSYANRYYKLLPSSSSSNAQLIIKVQFTGANASDGVCQGYYKRRNGTHTSITISPCAPNTYIIDTSYFGAEVEWVGAIISSIGDNAVTYNITYSAANGSHQTFTIPPVNRYAERIATLVGNSFMEYWVTFTTSGNRVVQTLGADHSAADGYLILYDQYGNKLEENDDSGYGLNALISYNFEANKQYRVRVCFTGIPEENRIKVAFIPADVDSYYDFPSIVGDSGVAESSFVQNRVSVFTFMEGSTTRLRKIDAEADIDLVMYIIDPTSAEGLFTCSYEDESVDKYADNIFNDDSIDSLNPYIEKYTEPYVEYLIIVSAHNPSTVTTGEQYTLTVD